MSANRIAHDIAKAMSLGNPSLYILIQRIRENDPTLIELGDGEDSPSSSLRIGRDDYPALIEALRLNRTISKVNLIFRSLDTLTEVEQSDFVEAIGLLPNLQQLQFTTLSLSGQPLRVLNKGLSKTKGCLKSLSIQHVHPGHGTVYFRTDRTSNTNHLEFVEFLWILSNVVKKSVESFTLLDIDDTFDVDALLQVLLVFPNLQELILQAHSALRPRLSGQSVMELLGSKRLRSLTLRRLGLGPILAEPLMLMISKNDVIESLSLEHNGLNFQCGMSIAYVLSVNKMCKELNLSNNAIPDDAGSAIIGALTDNTTLISLNLSGNILGLNVAGRIAHLLAHNESNLQMLSLNQNPIGHDGVAMIAFHLENNTTLRELSMAETLMSHLSCSLIVACLYINTTLKRLNLAKNCLGDTAGIEFATVLRRNSTLSSLDLHNTMLGDSSALPFAETLKVNNTIENLNLGGNNEFSAQVYDTLEQVLVDHNYAIQHLLLPSSVETVSPNCMISSFTLLNRMGRKRLLNELSNAQLWLDAIQKTRIHDLSSLYYLIRTNPAVVSWMKV